MGVCSVRGVRVCSGWDLCRGEAVRSAPCVQEDLPHPFLGTLEPRGPEQRRRPAWTAEPGSSPGALVSMTVRETTWLLRGGEHPGGWAAGCYHIPNPRAQCFSRAPSRHLCL